MNHYMSVWSLPIGICTVLVLTVAPSTRSALFLFGMFVVMNVLGYVAGRRR